MQRWDEAVYSYIEGQTRLADPLLDEMEARAAREGFPIIGAQVGCWLHALTRLTGARRVYELGSGYGYSTWYFCKAVLENAQSAASSGGGSPSPPKVVHTVWDSQLSADARQNLARGGYAGICEFVDGEAVAALTAAEPGWDIIFMDIDKEGYPAAIPVIEQKLRPGGLLLVDNVLWSGSVVDPADMRASTEGIRAMSAYLSGSPRWDWLILPLRDGLGIGLFGG